MLDLFRLASLVYLNIRKCLQFSRYHMECLDPPLDRVPVEEWFCPDCEPPLRPQRRRSSTRVDDDVTLEILQVTYVRRTRHPRQVARTRISERVRATIAERRRANRIISDSEVVFMG